MKKIRKKHVDEQGRRLASTELESVTPDSKLVWKLVVATVVTLGACALVAFLPKTYSIHGKDLDSATSAEFESKSLPANDTKEVSNLYLQYILTAFQMPQAPETRQDGAIKIVYAGRDGHQWAWDNQAGMQDGRVRLKVSDFTKLGYNVGFDPKQQIVMMASTSSRFILFFSSRPQSNHVMGLWWDKPADFDVWYQEIWSGKQSVDKPPVHVYTASVPDSPVSPSDASGIPVPIRVLAGAVRCDPKSVWYDTSKPVIGNHFVIPTPLSVQTLMEVPGALNASWTAPRYVVARFGKA